ncbi:hypothetical protein ACVWZA_000535 [Sphingomonas sp. UYAg733]
MRHTAILLSLVLAATFAGPAIGNAQPRTAPTGLVSVGSPAPAAPLWPAALTGVVGLLGVLAGGYFATRNSKAAIVQKTNELEIASIDSRLSGFVAPFEQLSLENLKLSRELKRQHGGDTFRTLPALLQPGWKDGLGMGDRTLVDAIVENGAKLREMILAHGGAVSPTVRPHLAAASMHFRMLALADAGSLDPDPDRYAAYVYPRQLDGALALERARLELRREVLRSMPDTSHAAMADLVLPHELALADTADLPAHAETATPTS